MQEKKGNPFAFWNSLKLLMLQANSCIKKRILFSQNANADFQIPINSIWYWKLVAKVTKIKLTNDY